MKLLVTIGSTHFTCESDLDELFKLLSGITIVDKSYIDDTVSTKREQTISVSILRKGPELVEEAEPTFLVDKRPEHAQR